MNDGIGKCALPVCGVLAHHGSSSFARISLSQTSDTARIASRIMSTTTVGAVMLGV
jgi:hypothetical protein